jgi:copper homeostasis protein (lipoprotein)
MIISPPPAFAATMSPRTRLFALLPLLVLAACKPPGGQGAPTTAAGGEQVVPAGAQDTERTWAGLLPCADCQGIDTRLVLRTEDGKRNYMLTETYLGGTGKTSFNRAGTWTELQARTGGEARVTYVLDPDKAAQHYALQPDGALELLGADGKEPQDALAYRLQRL